jgi:hypothetical protein
MAALACPACGQELEARRDFCPHCGLARVRAGRLFGSRALWISLILVGALLVAWGLMLLASRC